MKKAKAPKKTPPETNWVHKPPAEQQLQEKTDALFDISQLADEIKDPEVFRKWARRIANEKKSMTYKISFSYKKRGTFQPTKPNPTKTK